MSVESSHKEKIVELEEKNEDLENENRRLAKRNDELQEEIGNLEDEIWSLETEQRDNNDEATVALFQALESECVNHHHLMDLAHEFAQSSKPELRTTGRLIEAAIKLVQS